MSFIAAVDAAHGWLAGALLLAARLGGLLLVAPPLGGRAIPPTVRVGLVVALAALLAAALPGARAEIRSAGALIAALAGEITLGATMALGVSLAFAAFAIGARLLDVQIGFGIGQVFDPTTQTQLPVLSGIVAQLAIVGFFLADAHVSVARGLAASIERFPPGRAFPLDATIGPVLQQAAAAFALGFAIVAPVVLCLALVDLGLGVLARSLPQMNMFVLGVPVKIVVGIAALSLWIGTAGSVVARIHASIFAGWQAMFR